MQPWWIAAPERLAYELRKLDESGIAWTVTRQDEATGELALDLKAAVRGKPEHFVAVFPPFFPYVRFEVYAPDWQLRRHQNPYSKNLCLIGRSSENWAIDDTLAAFIVERVALLLDVVEEEQADRLIGREERQAEPLSAYTRAEEDSVVLIDSDWTIGSETRSGTLLLGVEQSNPIRAAVLEVYNEAGVLVCGAHAAIRRRYGRRTIRGRWLRMDSEIRKESAKEFLDEAVQATAANLAPRWQALDEQRVDFVGVVFPEELKWRQHADGWMFIVRRPEARAGFRAGRYCSTQYARTGRAGPRDIAWRPPELAFLQSRTIALVGLGCLGSAVALEFARAGIGHLRIMDADVIEAATTMRWPLGLGAAGRTKTRTLFDFIGFQYPYTNVEGFETRFGPVIAMSGVNLADAERFLSDADILVDATAEPGIHYLLAQIARERQIPYVALSATPGAWGGMVIRIDPRRTAACWSCYRHARANSIIEGPPEDPAILDQPPGCAEPTFTGASFDLLNVVAMAVRLTIGTLSDHESYPDLPLDGAMLSLRDHDGEPIAPRWIPFSLSIAPQCTNHSS
jgi:ThiF family protein/E2/UBC family protein B